MAGLLSVCVCVPPFRLHVTGGGRPHSLPTDRLAAPESHRSPAPADSRALLVGSCPSHASLLKVHPPIELIFASPAEDASGPRGAICMLYLRSQGVDSVWERGDQTSLFSFLSITTDPLSLTCSQSVLPDISLHLASSVPPWD